MSTEPDCLFCKIVADSVPADKLYEDAEVMAFKDIRPQAPFHALPRRRRMKGQLG